MAAKLVLACCLVFMVPACTGSVPSAVPPVGVGVDGWVHVNEDRSRATFVLRNANPYDVVCGPLYQRVVFDAPQSYLDVGEKVRYGSDVYLVSGKEVNSIVGTSDFSGDGSRRREIQFGTFGSGSLKCRWADIVDYCATSVLEPGEAEKSRDLKIDKILQSFNVNNCGELVQRVESPFFWRDPARLPSEQQQFLKRFARYAESV
jgi:hypothetical protein